MSEKENCEGITRQFSPGQSPQSMESTSTNVQVVLCATLEGHKDSVTSIAAPSDPEARFIVSGSRGMISFLSS